MILSEAKEILAKIPSGTRLLDVLSNNSVPVKTMAGKELTYTTPDEQSIFIVLPPHSEKNPELVAMTLGCAIRDIEQSIKGFTKPDPQLDPVEFASITFSRTLDILVSMCQIADDLKEELGFTKPLDIIDDLGHNDLYKAYKDNADHDQMIEVLVGSVNN